MTMTERRAPKVTSKITYDLTKVYINGIVHLAFVRRDVVGFQTWKSVSVYWLELTFRDGATLLTEYDNAPLWGKVIALIEDNLTP